MSTGAAIAGTTQLLRLALQEFLPELSGPLGDKPAVTALPPDRITTGNTEPVQLNVFHYRTEPNPAWRNVGLPTRDGSGRRLSQPPLGLNLHYLVSAYAKLDLHADVLLGHAMEVLHGLSVLTPAMIAQRFGAQRPENVTAELWALLQGSGLDRQADQLTVTLEPLSVDDISKLWSVLGEKYRPSAAYVVSVVLIEPKGPAVAPLAVTQQPQPEIAVRLRPTLTGLSPEILPYAANATVTLLGSGLVGFDTRVLVGGTERTPMDGGTPDRLVVQLPPGMPAGVVPVQVRHSVRIGTQDKEFERSNALSLTVQPVPGEASILPAAADVPRRISVPVSPDVGSDQQVRLLLNQLGSTVSRSMPAMPLSDPAATVEFPIPSDLQAGTYLYRLSVDGATSGLERSGGTTFDGPTVVVT